jgi:Carboxypeptidase regulatory-like domain
MFIVCQVRVTGGATQSAVGASGSVIDLARAAGAACLLTLIGLMLVPGVAGAESTGAIAGKVTVAATGVSIEGAEVCAEAAGSGGNSVSCTLTGADGGYTISGLASGEYRVAFTDGVVCPEKQLGTVFIPQHYNNKPSLLQADAVLVTAPETTTGIDAGVVLGEAPGGDPVNTYGCNAGPSEPTGEGTSTLPGAIEPAPVNKQIEEEFWAHPPWDKPASPPAPAVVGVAVAVDDAALKAGSVALVLHCTGGGACKGMVKLEASLSSRRVVNRDGRRLAIRSMHEVVIGTAGFSLAPDASEALHVRLTSTGRALLPRAGKKVLKVRLLGRGVKAGALVLT